MEETAQRVTISLMLVEAKKQPHPEAKGPDAPWDGVVGLNHRIL